MKSLEEHRRLVIGSIAAATVVLSAARVIVISDAPIIDIDAAFFQHAGWYVTQGATPYVDIWDIKPPLTIWTTTVLAVLSFGSMSGLHMMSTMIIALAFVVIAVLVSDITHRMTGDARAGLAAGISILVFPGFHYLAVRGFRPKYLAIVLGLAAIQLQAHDRQVSSGASAAASAGFVQQGIVFPLLVAGMAAQEADRGRTERLGRTIGGMAAVTAVVVLPVLVTGAFDPMLEQVVVPLGTSDRTPLLSIIGKGIVILGYAVVPVLVGVYGLIRAGVRDPAETWWVVVGGGLYGVQIFLLDFDAYPDLFFGLVFVAFGIGLAVDTTGDRSGEVIVVLVTTVALISVLLLGGIGIASHPVTTEEPTQKTLPQVVISTVEATVFGGEYHTSDATEANAIDGIDSPYGPERMRYLYWNKVKPDSCHYRLSGPEIKWIRKTSDSFMTKQCG